MRKSLFFLTIVLISCKSQIEKESVTIYCGNRTINMPIEKINLKKKSSIKESDGKLVQLEGVFSFNFEDVAIYPDKDWDKKDALWLNLLIPESLKSKTFDSLHGKKILVFGRINIKDPGHDNAYLGTLDSVYCMKVYK